MMVILFLEWVSNLLFQRDTLAIMTDFRIRNGTHRFIVCLRCRFYPKFEVKPTTISVCRSTIAAFTNGDMAVYQRIQKFGKGGGLRPRFDNSVTPLDFMFRQLFHRLFIVSPAFIRVRSQVFVLELEKPEHSRRKRSISPCYRHLEDGFRSRRFVAFLSVLELFQRYNNRSL